MPKRSTMATNVTIQNPVVQVSETANKEPNVEMVNLVKIENSQVVTTSLKIAEIFGKSHAHVLRDIKALECSDSFRKSNFGLSYIIKQLPNNGSKQLPMYYITRDGFMFLVMGFTGKTAAKWKEAYIKAFNDMEAKLRAEQMPTTTEQPDTTETMAKPVSTGYKSSPIDPTKESIVIKYRGRHVIMSTTLAELLGRRHCDLLKSIRRTMMKCERPKQMFFEGQRAVRVPNSQCVKGSLIYYITIGGFQYFTLYTRSVSDDMADMIRRAFKSPNGMVKEYQALPRKPKAPTTPPTTTAKTQPSAKPTPQAPTAANMPQTPADLMQRFVKAMGVMMGVDTNEMFNLTNKGE